MSFTSKVLIRFPFMPRIHGFSLFPKIAMVDKYRISLLCNGIINQGLGCSDTRDDLFDLRFAFYLQTVRRVIVNSVCAKFFVLVNVQVLDCSWFLRKKKRVRYGKRFQKKWLVQKEWGNALASRVSVITQVYYLKRDSLYI